jgi:oligopeptide/dipeptide ABC transporter ATP-binding protein
MTQKPELVVEVTQLRKLFPVRASSLFEREERFVHAIDDVTFSVARGEIVALVGESGCGKSTLALALMGLEPPTTGSIRIAGEEITTLSHSEMKHVRRQIQMIFQDPYESLNPMMTVGDVVAEPLQVHRLAKSRSEREERVIQALQDAGLQPARDYLFRRPHELSGGQRQRVVIAGALVLEPEVLVADEPVSMLDVSIRAEILNLLVELRDNRGISVLLITHDLGTVGYVADRIAVMYLGRIVEIGPTLDVLQNPAHPYTRALLSVVPVPNPRLRRERIILQGETPNPIDLPTGCRFHPRCPLAFDRCQKDDPPETVVGTQHVANCWLIDP